MAHDTRPRLLQALRELAQHQVPHSITHKQIARVTGISLPTVQKHLGAPENFAALLQFEDEHQETAATRERILTAASAVFAERGYSGASLDMVARTAGMTKGAIYWHFSSKAELFCALLERRCQQDDAVIDPLLDVSQLQALDLTQAQDIMEQAMRQVSHDPSWPRLYMEFVTQAREPEIAARLARLYHQSCDKSAGLHEQLKAIGRINASFDARTLARFWMTLIDGLLLASMVNPDDTDLPRLVREFTRIAWEGVRPMTTGDQT